MAQAKGRRSDTPTITSTAADLDSEVAPEPYVHVLGNGHRVQFPDPFEMEWEAAEEFLERLSVVGNTKAALQEWLSEEDYKALKAENLTLRKLLALMKRVQDHYEGIFGSPGEEPASAT